MPICLSTAHRKVWYIFFFLFYSGILYFLYLSMVVPPSIGHMRRFARKSTYCRLQQCWDRLGQSSPIVYWAYVLRDFKLPKLCRFKRFFWFCFQHVILWPKENISMEKSQNRTFLSQVGILMRWLVCARVQRQVKREHPYRLFLDQALCFETVLQVHSVSSVAAWLLSTQHRIETPCGCEDCKIRMRRVDLQQLMLSWRLV